VEFGRGSGERQDAKERAKKLDHYNSTAQVKKATVRDTKRWFSRKANVKGASGAETFWDRSTLNLGPVTLTSAFRIMYTYCESQRYREKEKRLYIRKGL
jgi:hypothetical protein